MTLLGGRSPRAELLDGDGHDPRVLDESLAQVTAANRWLGGVRSLRLGLRPLLGRERVRVLDVGTGNGDVLRELVAWGNGRGAGRWEGTGVDLDAATLTAARDREGGPNARIALVRGDARRLPFRDRSFDAVIATLTLHHFPDPEAVHILREMRRVCRGWIVVSDLERTVPNYVGARLLALTWWRRNRLTRHDGPLSVLRSFTRSELAALAARAGLVGARVQRRIPFRLVLEAPVDGRREASR